MTNITFLIILILSIEIYYNIGTITEYMNPEVKRSKGMGIVDAYIFSRDVDAKIIDEWVIEKGIFNKKPLEMKKI